jgi:methionyl-tRNA formyltransferase
VRVIYFGSPEFAVPTLRAIAADGEFDVALVVTQGAKGASPVEIAAQEIGVPIYKPETLRDVPSREPLLEANADLFVVAAFGLIFGRKTLEIPRLGAINVHPSLLPKYRGASPIMAAIESGDEMTGVSLMAMDSGIDTGAVVSVEDVVVAGDDTTESLGRRLAEVAARQAVRDIPRWANDELRAAPQPTTEASLTRPLSKSDGWIDWARSAVEIERHIRAMWPWPRAWTSVEESTIQIHQARVVESDVIAAEPGVVISSRKQIVVACGTGALELLTVEPAGRRAMTASAYLNGLRRPLSRLGDPAVAPDRPPLIVPLQDC